MAYPDNNSLPHTLWALSIIFGLLPTVIIALRFYAKPKSSRRIFLDDWFILLAWLSCIIYAVFVIVGVEGGRLGRPLRRDANGEPIYDHEFFLYQKVSYVTNAVQITALGPTKLSVLFFYRRVFNVDNRGFNIISSILLGLIVVWTIAFFFTNVFTYTPIADMWTKPPGEAHATFDHVTDMYNAQCFSDMALDVIIMILPIPQIWRLQISLSKKVQISGIFLLGLFTIGASVARAVIQYKAAELFNEGNPDQTYFLSPHIYWVMIEIAVGIIAACLPLLHPLGKVFSLKSLLVVSAKAISSIFTSSTATHVQLSGEEPSHRDEENTVLHSAGASSGKSGKWRDKRYDISCLDETVDNESRIESHEMTDTSEWSHGDGIHYVKNYEVSHVIKKGGESYQLESKG